jgi:hypothetical protein
MLEDVNKLLRGLHVQLGEAGSAVVGVPEVLQRHPSHYKKGMNREVSDD